MKLIIEKIHEFAKLPTFGTIMSSGMDLYSVEDITINPFKRHIIKTGIKIKIPENHEIQIRPRSGLAAKQGLTILNSPATIDQDYLGEIMVIAYNADDTNPIEIKVGDRIAQMVLSPVINGSMIEIQEGTLNGVETDRGSNGFGSTGIR